MKYQILLLASVLVVSHNKENECSVIPQEIIESIINYYQFGLEQWKNNNIINVNKKNYIYERN